MTDERAEWFSRQPLSDFEGGGIVREISGRDTGLTAHKYLADSSMPWLTEAARASSDVPIMTTGPNFEAEMVSD